MESDSLLNTVSPALQSLALLSLAGLPVAKIAALVAAVGGTAIAVEKSLPPLKQLESRLNFLTDGTTRWNDSTSDLPDSIGHALEEIKLSFQSLAYGFVAAMSRSGEPSSATP